MAATTNFDPQAGFVVTASESFVSFNEKTLTMFYQPIIGTVAFSLFYALTSYLQPKPTISSRLLQSALLAQVNAGGQQVEEALHRLEAVGLVQTYFQHDELGDVYVYQLRPTLTPAEFVNDNLLSILLLEEIGEQAFEKLVTQSRQYVLASENTDLVDISHHFFDEFHVDSHSITKTPTVITKLRTAAPVEKQDSLTAGLQNDFNWKVLNELLAQQPIVKADLENNRELILMEHQLYGIDEPTMKKIILRSVEFGNNHFDPQKFKRIIASSYNVVYSQADKVAEEKQPLSVETNNQLTDKDRQLLAVTKAYSPIEFLQLLKGQTGGYVTSAERHLLTRLVEDGKLNSDVINVLTWYVIGDRGNSTLSTNFVDAIANNWLRKKITDGASALLQLKTFSKQSNEKKQRAPRSKKWQQNKIEEPMPEWSKKDHKELTKKASAQEVAKLRARIANRKKK